MVRQAPKMSARVVNAIRNLCDVHGSSSKQILNYVMAQNDINNDTSTVKRQIWGALKRGLTYGILKKSNGHYTLNTEMEMDDIDTIVEPTRRRRGRAKRRKSRRGRRKKSRSRRRRSSRRRKRATSRRRTRGRKRSSSRRRRQGRTRRRANSAGDGRKQHICEYCRSLSIKSQDVDLQKRSPSPEVLEDAAPKDQREREEQQNRRSKSRQRNRSRSRSVVNKDATVSD